MQELGICSGAGPGCRSVRGASLDAQVVFSGWQIRRPSGIVELAAASLDFGLPTRWCDHCELVKQAQDPARDVRGERRERDDLVKRDSEVIVPSWKHKLDSDGAGTIGNMLDAEVPGGEHAKQVVHCVERLHGRRGVIHRR